MELKLRQPRAGTASSLELAVAAAKTADLNQGADIVVLDMRESSPIFDYFVLVTGRSRRQMHAISEEIDHKLEDELGDRRLGIEGYEASRWILLDYGTVVIHIFDSETRGYYALEELWAGAKRVPVEGLSPSPPRTALGQGYPRPLTGGDLVDDVEAPADEAHDEEAESGQEESERDQAVDRATASGETGAGDENSAADEAR